jgi:hypothetical protein
VWCTQNKVIQDQDIIHDLHILLHNGALIPLAYRIEEYLAVAQLKEQCLRAVLNPYVQVEAIHYQLTRFPFRGYITTSYDTCIETAYRETLQGQLGKFYQSSLARAVDACRKKQPFILKLYGDLAEPDSIKLGHRLLTGLHAEDVRQQLRQLFFETPAIFVGFDDADGDLPILRSLVTNRRNDQQKHSTHAREPHDGTITKPADQSPLDSTAHDFSPGDHPPRPVISSQSQNITSKDEQPEKETLPDTTKQEAISILAFAEGQQKGNSTSTGSSQSSSDPSAGHDGLNGQTPNQLPNSPFNNLEPGSPSADETQLRESFEKRFSSGNLQLPDELPLFKKFKSLLNNLLFLKENQEEMEKIGDSLQKQFTLLENKEKHLSLAFIYIPGSVMNDPDKTDAIAGLCFAFPEGTFLKVCTDSGTSCFQIEQLIEKNWSSWLKNPVIIVYGHHIQDVVSNHRYNDARRKYWITQILKL